MAKNANPDYKRIFEKNPYILYSKKTEKYFCETCEKEFESKKGANAHSSKTHDIALSGKKTIRVRQNYIISEQNHTYQEEKTEMPDTDQENQIFEEQEFENPLEQEINKIDRLLEETGRAEKQIRKCEELGLYEKANEIREMHGIKIPEKLPDNSGAKDLVFMHLMQETDQETKNKLSILYYSITDMTPPFQIIAMLNQIKSSKPIPKNADDDEMTKLFKQIMVLQSAQNPRLKQDFLSLIILAKKNNQQKTNRLFFQGFRMFMKPELLGYSQKTNDTKSDKPKDLDSSTKVVQSKIRTIIPIKKSTIIPVKRVKISPNEKECNKENSKADDSDD